MQSQTEAEIFEIINKYHELLRKSGLKTQPEKTKFVLIFLDTRTQKTLNDIKSRSSVDTI